ncbi:hypothetical protein ABIC22_004781 [Paenibacillus sp. PvP094]|uniref:hypothetical protein n=1 Tax=Paenibacillus sp. PvP094 TaxID=3156394 RepID=UPI003392BFA7
MKYIIMIIMIAIIAGCGGKNDGEQMMSTGDILANEMIKKDPSADLFLFNERVYIRKEEINNINQLGEMLGKIKSNYEKEGEFKDLMSTELSVGTEAKIIMTLTNFDLLALYICVAGQEHCSILSRYFSGFFVLRNQVLDPS